MTQSTIAWWQRGVFYQIYPRSFMDSNNDGIGDLRGIADRLDYLAWLGVDGLWLSPIFPSPMADFGYDVADYVNIDPIFGSLADFDHLLAQAPALNTRSALDRVPNNTSTQHQWFLDSRSSRDNPKRDWYIWRDAQPDGSPPNNWLAYFGGPAWTWDETTQQYYLHSFLPEQPDLNWHNPAVRQAVYDSIRFWLDRGVDGFRIDVIDRMIKDEALRDNPPDPGYVEGRDNPAHRFLRVYSEGRPGVHDLIREFRQVFDAYADRVSIGEIAYSLNPGIITAFYGQPPRGDELHLPFNFALIMLDWQAERVKAFVDAYEGALPPYGWPTYVLSNHDQTRVGTRIGSDQVRVAAMLLLTLRGTPFLYYGDELGMLDVSIPAEQYQDPQGINLGFSRDPERTPMQWDASPHAGYSAAEPWLPVAPDYAQVNVEAEKSDPRSVLALYKRLIDLRRTDEALSLGAYAPLDAPEGVFAYTRGAKYTVALNFSGSSRTLNTGGTIVLSTELDRDDTVASVTLRPHEGVILRNV